MNPMGVPQASPPEPQGLAPGFPQTRRSSAPSGSASPSSQSAGGPSRMAQW